MLNYFSFISMSFGCKQNKSRSYQDPWQEGQEPNLGERWGERLDPDGHWMKPQLHVYPDQRLAAIVSSSLVISNYKNMDKTRAHHHVHKEQKGAQKLLI